MNYRKRWGLDGSRFHHRAHNEDIVSPWGGCQRTTSRKIPRMTKVRTTTPERDHGHSVPTWGKCVGRTQVVSMAPNKQLKYQTTAKGSFICAKTSCKSFVSVWWSIWSGHWKMVAVNVPHGSIISWCPLNLPLNYRPILNTWFQLIRHVSIELSMLHREDWGKHKQHKQLVPSREREEQHSWTAVLTLYCVIRLRHSVASN